MPASPRVAFQRFVIGLLPAAVAFSILWKGGKSLETTWLLALLAGFVAFAWWREHGGTKDAISRPLWLCTIGFVLWTACSYFLSSTRNYGLDEVLRDGSLVVLFMWAVRCFSREGGLPMERMLLRTIGICALVACAIGVAVYVLQPVNRFVGVFFDHRFDTDYWPNAWAQFLLLAWPAFLASRDSRGQRGWWTAAGAGLLLGGLLLSYSRGGFLAFVGQLALALLLSVPWRRSVWHGRTLMLGMFTLVIACSMFVGANAVRALYHDVQSVTEKVTFTAAEGTSSIDERSEFWRHAVQLARERPMFGWGPYSFRFVHTRLQRHVLATSDHPHNVFLKLAMERGIPAVILFIAIVVLALAGATYALLRPVLDIRDIHMRYALIAVEGVLAHNLIDFNLQFVGVALPFWLLLAVIASRARSAAPKPFEGRVRRGIEVALACLVLVVAIAEGRMLTLSSLGRHAEAEGDATGALHWYTAAEHEWFSRDMHLSEAALLSDAGKPQEAIAALDVYQDENAQDARAWKLQGDALLRQENLPDAAEAYEQAYEAGRYNYVAVADSWMQILERQRRMDELRNMRPEADALFAAYVQAVHQNTHFIALSQNVEQLTAWANTLARLYPDAAQRYQADAEKAARKAEEEREAFSARIGGMLW